MKRESITLSASLDAARTSLAKARSRIADIEVKIYYMKDSLEEVLSLLEWVVTNFREFDAHR